MRRSIFGKHNSEDKYGLWISKPGIDVYEVTTPRDYLFSTDEVGYLRPYMIGSFAKVDAAAFTETIPHGLPYIPYAYAFPAGELSAGFVSRHLVEIDATNLTIRCTTQTLGQTWNYFIFENPFAEVIGESV